jgi:hypothetical protein
VNSFRDLELPTFSELELGHLQEKMVMAKKNLRGGVRVSKVSGSKSPVKQLLSGFVCGCGKPERGLMGTSMRGPQL